MSKTVVVGEITPYNENIINEIKAGYNKAFIRTVKGMKELYTLNNSPPPILGLKYLVVMDVETWSKSANSLLDKIDNIPDNNYVDILVRLKIKGPNELVTTSKLINLDRTRYSDFKKYVAKDLGIQEETANFVVKKIGVSLPVYNLYRYKLLDAKPLDKKVISNIIKIKKGKPLLEILEGIVNKSDAAYKDYMRSVYPEPWFREYFIKELDKVIELKIQLRNRQRSAHNLREDDKVRKYYSMVNNTNITNCFLLRQLLLQYKQGGVERYYITDIKTFIVNER